MNIAVLGGNGSIDQHVLDRALDHGYSVSALLTAGTAYTGVNVVGGSINDISALETVLQNAHAVISLPGAITTFNDLSAVVHIMHAYGIRRLIIAADLHDRQPLRFAEILRRATIDWTLVQVAPQTNENTFAVKGADFAKYLLGQITEVDNLRSAVLLSN